MKNYLRNNKVKAGVVAVISIVLIFVLTQIYAADLITTVVTTSATKAKPGETITLALSAKDFKTDAAELANGITEYQIGSLEYDKNVFEEITAEAMTAGTGWGEVTYSSGKILLGTNTAKTTDCDIITITFKVKEGASAGTTTIALKDMSAAGGNGDISLTNVEKSITIENTTDGNTTDENNTTDGNTTDENNTTDGNTTDGNTTDENNTTGGNTTDGNNTTGGNTTNGNNTSGGNISLNRTNTGSQNTNLSGKGLPYAGITSFIVPIIALLAIVARVSYIRYKNIDK